MECTICFREYRLSPSAEVAFPRVGTCGHSLCNDCCSQLPAHKNCPYCNHARSFERQPRNFLAEDCLALMENTDLVESLLPQLKGLVLDLIDRKTELDAEVKKSKGFTAWLMQKTGGGKEQKEKDRKEVLALQKKVDTLIDMTTAVMRPKLLVTIVPLSYGFLQLEARFIQELPLSEHIHGPPTDLCGCIWKIYIYKYKRDGKFYLIVGVDMKTVDKASTKKYRGTGTFKAICQKYGGTDYEFSKFKCNFNGPNAKMENIASGSPLWEDIVNETSGYLLNDRLYIQCEKWEVKEVE